MRSCESSGVIENILWWRGVIKLYYKIKNLKKVNKNLQTFDNSSYYINKILLFILHLIITKTKL